MKLINKSINEITAAAAGIITEMLKEREYLTAAIDGRCASGKTTLADTLSRELSCCCIHMDDFFLRPHQRTPERFSIPGGNIDHERFLEEVLTPLKKRHPFSYRPYDCSLQSLKAPVYVDPGRIILIEGTYSCHPELRNYYDFRIFMDVSQDTQRNRVLMRSPGLAYRFFDEWIPLEEEYISACGVEKCCELTILSE